MKAKKEKKSKRKRERGWRSVGLLLVAVLLLDLLNLLWSGSLAGRVHDRHAGAGHRAAAVPGRAHGGALWRHAT